MFPCALCVEGFDFDFSNRVKSLAESSFHYSYRSASIGSSLAALIAGTIPLTTPTTAKIPVATNRIMGETINRMSPASACLAIAL